MKVQEMFAYISVKDAAKAIEFYKEAFGAKEKFRLTEPSGRIGHAELDFGCGTLMLADEFPDCGFSGPQEAHGARYFQIHLHVDNADELVARALRLGAQIVHPLKDQFYGERSGTIRDPFGHQWNIGHHIEDVSLADMQRRYDDMMKATPT